jgi:DNA repair protein RadA/Sms
VAHAAQRLREAQKLGFLGAVTGRLGKGDVPNGIAVGEYAELAELIGRIAARGQRQAAE